MPLEDLIGNKYVNSLNESWPLGSDNKDAGDNHLRGIKNVLKRTFPKLTGPVTLSQKDLTYGTLPEGARMFFYMAAPPAGWKRVTGISDTRMLRVVPTASAGGTQGGTHDPIYNDHIPPHVHPLTGAATGTQSANHAHGINIVSSVETAAHTHSGTTSEVANSVSSYGISYTPGGSSAFYVSSPHSHTFTTGAENATHTHVVTGNSGIESANHTHALTGNTGSNSGTLATGWAPRYFDIILCERENPTA